MSQSLALCWRRRDDWHLPTDARALLPFPLAIVSPSALLAGPTGRTPTAHFFLAMMGRSMGV